MLFPPEHLCFLESILYSPLLITGNRGLAPSLTIVLSIYRQEDGGNGSYGTSLRLVDRSQEFLALLPPKCHCSPSHGRMLLESILLHQKAAIYGQAIEFAHTILLPTGMPKTLLTEGWSWGSGQGSIFYWRRRSQKVGSPHKAHSWLAFGYA